MKGVIARRNKHKHFCFVLADGFSYYLPDPKFQFKDGMKVEFTPDKDEKGLIAKEVRYESGTEGT